MSAIARVRRQYTHQYGRDEFVGTVGEMSPSEGTCTFVTEDDTLRTLWLRHLAELREAAEDVDYLRMARNRGWKGQ